MSRAGNALVALLGLALVAGQVSAQAPDLAQRQQQRKGDVVWEWKAAGGPDALLTMEDADLVVANADNGVELTLTTGKPEAVEPLQERVERVVQGIHQGMAKVAARGRQGLAKGPKAGMIANNLASLLWGGDVEVSSWRVEQGIVVTITSEDGETARLIRDNMPQWIEQAGERKKLREEAMRRYRLRVALNQLLAQGKIRVETVQADDGVTVKFISDDPAVVGKLQELLPGYFEAMQEGLFGPMVLTTGVLMKPAMAPEGKGVWMREGKPAKKREGRPQKF